MLVRVVADELPVAGAVLGGALDDKAVVGPHDEGAADALASGGLVDEDGAFVHQGPLRRFTEDLNDAALAARDAGVVDRRSAAGGVRRAAAVIGHCPAQAAGVPRRPVQDLDVHVVWRYDSRLRQSSKAHGRSWWRTLVAEWLGRRRAPHESVYLAADIARAVKAEAALVAASATRVADATPIEILTAEKAAAVLYRLFNGGLGSWTAGMRTDAGANWRLAGEDVAADRHALHVGGKQFGIWSCVAPPATVTANALAELYAAPMTVLVEWRPWSREAARRKLRSAQRHYFSKRYSMVAHMQENQLRNTRG